MSLRRLENVEVSLGEYRRVSENFVEFWKIFWRV